MIRQIAMWMFLLAILTPAMAHHPTAGLWPPRCEPFDWIEKLEPKNYRERYNRPRYLGGKIAYYIAPSSQEAMAWHEHQHRGSYKNHAGPIFKQYYYPKPWEALQVGPRSGNGPSAAEVIIPVPDRSDNRMESPLQLSPSGY